MPCILSYRAAPENEAPENEMCEPCKLSYRAAPENELCAGPVRA